MLRSRIIGSKRAGGSPSFRSSSSAVVSSTTIDITVSAPSGVTNGDILLAFIRAGGVVTYTPPSGWTQLAYDATIVTQSISIAAYYKVASSEPASYTFSRSGTGGLMEVVVVAASGASSTITTGSVNSQYATSLVAQSISLSAPSLVFAVYQWGLTPIVSTAPTGMTAADVSTNNDGNNGVTVVYYVTESGSTSGDKTLTVSATAEAKSYLIGLYGA